MKNIEVCLTPDLISHFDLNEKVVVAIDIFRATSCMTTALANGVEAIIPVATVEECKALQEKGYLAAAERDGKKVEGFDLDNSPFSYLNPELEGKTLAMTTSNGTLVISKSKETAYKVVIGSFLNKTSVVQFLIKEQKDVVLFCAGWKGNVNLEDTFFAGALLNDLLHDFKYSNDSCALARSVYHLGKNAPKRFLMDSSHFNRLKKLGHEADMDFCLSIDNYQILPVLVGDRLVVE